MREWKLRWIFGSVEEVDGWMDGRVCLCTIGFLFYVFWCLFIRLCAFLSLRLPAPVLSKASSKRRQLAAIPEEIDVATHEFDECLGAAEIALVPSQDVYPVDESGEVIMDERERSYLKRYSMDARRLVRGYLTQSESIGAKYPGYNDLPNGCICPQPSSVSTFANMLEMMFGEGDLERGAGRKPKPKPVCIRSDLVTPTRSSLSVFDVHNIY